MYPMNIGLTGGIGCGKSTALSYFRQFGAEVMETDAIVRELLSSDGNLIEQVKAAFGSDIIDCEGKVDRAKLAAKVFHNSEALASLESLIHPRVRDYWMRALGESHPVLIVEIPLLFEKDLQEHFTLTICLSSHPEVQRQRLKARGMSESQIQYRKERQFSLEEKMQRADIILHNNGSLEHLKDQVKQVMGRLSDCSNL
jgi:dephospho-CoA kinase